MKFKAVISLIIVTLFLSLLSWAILSNIGKVIIRAMNVNWKDWLIGFGMVLGGLGFFWAANYLAEGGWKTIREMLR